MGTPSKPGTQAFDSSALAASFDKKLPGYAGAFSIEVLRGGQSNPTYKLNTAKQS